MAAHRRKLRLALAAAAIAAFAVAAPAHADLTQPVLLDPGNGASLEALPPFAWSPVPGADQYEFQVAADQNFNSPVLGRGEGSFVTKNTRATLRKTLPNGRYWWRVRATTRAATHRHGRRRARSSSRGTPSRPSATLRRATPSPSRRTDDAQLVADP